MKKEIYNAAEKGDMKFLEEAQEIDMEAAMAIYSNDDLLDVTSHGNNIIHIAAKHGHLDFIKGVLDHFQATNDHRRNLIICGRNLDGDIPLHFAAKQDTPSIAELLLKYCVELAPWRIQNNKGNTPLHVALMNGCKSLKVAARLIEVGPEVVSYTNHNQETPLHLVVEYDSKGAKLSIANMASKPLMNNLLRASLDYEKGFIEEDDVSLLKKLLESATTKVCYLRDKHGMTLLLKAAFNSYLSAVEAIINYCPESVEICDFKGKNILHHFTTFLDAKILLSTPKISALMDQQDEDGNTLLHIDIKNCDHCMMKAMMECNANFFIKNNEGNSPASLIQDESGSCLGKLDGITNKELLKDEIVKSKEWYEKGVNGEWVHLRKELIESGNENIFLSRLLDGTNIIHFAFQNLLWLAADFGQELHEKCIVAQKIIKDFIVDVLKKFPILSCHTNSHGQTPFHYAINREPHYGYKPVDVEEEVLFECIKENFRYIKAHENKRITCFLPPWKAKDDNGNTLLHLAVFNGMLEFAEYLIDKVDADLVGEVNNSKQTPLQFLFDFSIPIDYSRGPKEKMVELLLKKDVSAVNSRDVNGSTPLLTAVQNYSENKKAIIAMLKYCPQSIRDRDTQGRNIFHYLDHIADPNDDGVADPMKNLLKMIPQWEAERLIKQEDYEGNTPLDLAIQQGRYKTAKGLILCFEGKVVYGNNKKTKDMLVSAQIPSSFLDFLRRHSSILTGVIELHRSIYDVNKEEIKDYMSPMGVVAALLATVTFTAAFTVPGDYNNDGSPNLAKEAAFKVFMFSDVVGMCSSMMVLFCLLWILTSSFNNDDDDDDDGDGDFDERVVLVDMAISFLLVSFNATLVAFMTGVYVTTITSIPWLAIFTCVLCTLFLLLMRRGTIKIASKVLRGLPLFVKYDIRSCFQRARLANQDREQHSTTHSVSSS